MYEVMLYGEDDVLLDSFLYHELATMDAAVTSYCEENEIEALAYNYQEVF